MLSVRVVAFALLLVAVNCVTTYENHKVFRVHVTSEYEVDSLQSFVDRDANLSFWTEKYNVPGNLDIQVGPNVLDATIHFFEKLGVTFDVVHEDLQAIIDSIFEENLRIQSQQDDTFFQSYASFDQMEKFLRDLQASYPDMSSIVNIGTTIEGRPITGIVISGGSSQTKKKIVINGCQHAREWISPMTVAYVAQYLLQNYTLDAEVAAVVNAFEWTLIPIVNGDGYVYTWTEDRLWRKNRSPLNGTLCYGVDINRNWNYQWGTVGTNFIKCSDTYAGPSGFSEPEETAVANYISKGNGEVVAYIDYHAYGGLFMYPWGYVCDSPTPDADTQNTGAVIYAEALKSVNGLNFTTGPICDTIYPASGDSADWTYGAGGVVYSYACELRGNSFILPPEEIIPSGRENFAGIIAWSSFISSEVNK